MKAQYQRLVALAYDDLRHRFSETVVEKFLQQKAGVPFAVLLEARAPSDCIFCANNQPCPEHDSVRSINQVALWVEVLEFAKRATYVMHDDETPEPPEEKPVAVRDPIGEVRPVQQTGGLLGYVR